MKNSNLSWTPQTLDAYLADPQKLVPGNHMPYSGMPDAQERAALIAYLQSLH
jgi:cytochrome c